VAGANLTRREALLVLGVACASLAGCSSSAQPEQPQASITGMPVEDKPQAELQAQEQAPAEGAASSDAAAPEAALKSDGTGAGAGAAAAPKAPAAPADIQEDYRSGFCHGSKTAAYQKYIVLHDTEGDSDPDSVISWWDSNGNLVSSHFVVGKDGTIFQCVPLDTIAHHAGYGDTGHNALYGVPEDGRDDMRASVWIGSNFADYGMNAYSVGIEMVHIGGSGGYPEAQLNAVDSLIAHIDAYYGFASRIIDHKAWRSGNSDTSPEFATYLANYQDHRTHN